MIPPYRALRSKFTLADPHFWLVVALFMATSVGYYHELFAQIPILGQLSLTDLFKLERHTLDRFIYVCIVAYSGWVLGVQAGVAVLVATVLAMLPRAAFIAPDSRDTVVESMAALFTAGLIMAFIQACRSIREERDQLRNTMEKLRQSEENYRGLFENASDAVFVHDLKGDFIAANKAAEQMMGCTLSELLRKNACEFLSEDAHALANSVKSKLLKGEPVEPRYEQRLVKGDGTEAITEITTRLIMQHGQPVAFHNIARDVTEERRMRDSVRFYLQKILMAQEEERKRVARDLHDDTSQSMLLLMQRLDAVASDTRNRLPPPLREKLTELHGLAVKTLEGVRRYARGLRPAILDDLGLEAALEWLGDNLTAESGIAVDVKVDRLDRELPHLAQIVLFRIAQEALSNIKRHAGATKVALTLEAQSGKIRMTIADNGKGFQLPIHLSELSGDDKVGLMGMKERARLLGGTLRIRSAPGRGTSVIVEAPAEERFGIAPDAD